VENKIPQIIGTLGGTNELLSIIKTNDWTSITSSSAAT